jgi:hypothetical protein
MQFMTDRETAASQRLHDQLADSRVGLRWERIFRRLRPRGGRRSAAPEGCGPGRPPLPHRGVQRDHGAAECLRAC